MAEPRHPSCVQGTNLASADRVINCPLLGTTAAAAVCNAFLMFLYWTHNLLYG